MFSTTDSMEDRVSKRSRLLMEAISNITNNILVNDDAIMYSGNIHTSGLADDYVDQELAKLAEIEKSGKKRGMMEKAGYKHDRNSVEFDYEQSKALRESRILLALD